MINSSSCGLPVCFTVHAWPDSFHDARVCVYVCVCARVCLVAQLCPTLYDPMDCSPPGSSVHRDSPGKNAGVGCHSSLQGLFLTQEWNLGLLHCRWILYWLSHQGSPGEIIKDDFFFLRLSRTMASGVWRPSEVLPTAAGAQLMLPRDAGQGRPHLFVDSLQQL